MAVADLFWLEQQPVFGCRGLLLKVYFESAKLTSTTPATAIAQRAMAFSSWGQDRIDLNFL